MALRTMCLMLHKGYHGRKSVWSFLWLSTHHRCFARILPGTFFLARGVTLQAPPELPKCRHRDSWTMRSQDWWRSSKSLKVRSANWSWLRSLEQKHPALGKEPCHLVPQLNPRLFACVFIFYLVLSILLLDLLVKSRIRRLVSLL